MSQSQECIYIKLFLNLSSDLLPPVSLLGYPFTFFPRVDLLLPSSVTTEPLAFSWRGDFRLGGFFAVLLFAREPRCEQVCHLLKHVAFAFPLLLLHKKTPHVGQKYTVFFAFELPKRPTHRAQRVLSLRSVFFFFGVTFLPFDEFFLLLKHKKLANYQCCTCRKNTTSHIPGTRLGCFWSDFLRRYQKCHQREAISNTKRGITNLSINLTMVHLVESKIFKELKITGTMHLWSTNMP